MNASRKTLISSCLALFSLLFIFLTKSMPESQLWKGYKTVYVTSQKLSEENIYSVFLKKGLNKTVSRINQSVPVFSGIAPVQLQSKDSYLYKRNSFFTDKSNSYFIYYVPQNQSDKIEEVLTELNGYPETVAGVDGDAVFPWICPILCLILAGYLFYKTKRRLNFFLSILPFILFSFARPLYTVCAACCLAFAADFMAVNLYGRKNFLSDLKNSVFIVPLIIIPVFMMVFSSFLNSILFIFAFAGGWALVICAEELSLLYLNYRKISSFEFVYIKKSSSVKVINEKNFIHLAFLSGFILLFLVLSFFLTGKASSSIDSSDRPFLPGPVSSGIENALPDLRDFMDWSWLTMSFPYRKLGETAEADSLYGQSVCVSEYKEVSGQITQSLNKVLTYDSSFKASIYDKIEKINYPALEKMMLRQGKNTNYSYTKNGGISSEKSLGLILIFFSLTPLVLCLYFAAGKLRNGFSL